MPPRDVVSELYLLRMALVRVYVVNEQHTCTRTLKDGRTHRPTCIYILIGFAARIRRFFYSPLFRHHALKNRHHYACNIDNVHIEWVGVCVCGTPANAFPLQNISVALH